MRFSCVIAFIFISAVLFGQGGQIRGSLQNQLAEPLSFANVALYAVADSSLVKVEVTDDEGRFVLAAIPAGDYWLEATYVGLPPLHLPGLRVSNAQSLDLGILTFGEEAITLREATVKADRVLVEIKPDRTVFNVQGTINSTGQDAIELLRKAPGVLVDNNNSITVLGRSGVQIFVDGKLLPLRGDDLTAYLTNLQADQIDRIDIITNPGARYEAEGNAGIIDIRLKKDSNVGGNGTLNSTFSHGRYHRANLGGSGNLRTRRVNVYGSGNVFHNRNFHDMNFLNWQNDFFLDEIVRGKSQNRGFDLRGGADLFLGDKHTIGVLVSGGNTLGNNEGFNRVRIANAMTPNMPDSILIANNTNDDDRQRLTTNLNYRFDNRKGRVFNIDLDAGFFSNEARRFLPNRYMDPSGDIPLTEVTYGFYAPTDIAIYSFKADYEERFLGGDFGTGVKMTRVVSDNTFLVSDYVGNMPIPNQRLSNEFRYDEQVYAAYVQYARPILDKLQFSAGLRAEMTDATGDLVAFLPELQEPPVKLDFFNLFPSAGLTWQYAPMHTFALNYGRRINRPNYQVLNPFNNLLSELSFQKGNPFLRPEIVNNMELGYTWKYRYNFKLAYSLTTDQITRLIAPDDVDPRAGFITWENLATQAVWSFNFSAPIQVNKWWSAYFNVNAMHIDNQADYGNGAVVDVQAFSYNIYQQQVFTLPYGFKGEVSGWYSGPGVWGGVFVYEPSWSLDLGVQRRFLQDKINVRLSVSDIFYESYWRGKSEFNGLVARGNGNWDSRRGSISVTWDLGNAKFKSQRRKTGLEEEAKRVED